jgi:hypothetical protein
VEHIGGLVEGLIVGVKNIARHHVRLGVPDADRDRPVPRRVGQQEAVLKPFAAPCVRHVGGIGALDFGHLAWLHFKRPNPGFHALLLLCMYRAEGRLSQGCRKKEA